MTSYNDYLRRKNSCCLEGPPGQRGERGPTGVFGPTGYTGHTGFTGPTGAKTFVIDHPKDNNKYLVHACLEGPEVGVYYRGTAEIINNQSIRIVLPSYVPGWATDFVVLVTAIYDGKVKTFATSEVYQNGQFTVYGENGKFNWIAFGKRDTINVEPLKSELNVNGFGPYKWIE